MFDRLGLPDVARTTLPVFLTVFELAALDTVVGVEVREELEPGALEAVPIDAVALLVPATIVGRQRDRQPSDELLVECLVDVV